MKHHPKGKIEWHKNLADSPQSNLLGLHFQQTENVEWRRFINWTTCSCPVFLFCIARHVSAASSVIKEGWGNKVQSNVYN